MSKNKPLIVTRNSSFVILSQQTISNTTSCQAGFSPQFVILVETGVFYQCRARVASHSSSDNLQLWILIRLSVGLYLTTCPQASKHWSHESSRTTTHLSIRLIKRGQGVLALPLTFLLLLWRRIWVDEGRWRSNMISDAE